VFEIFQGKHQGSIFGTIMLIALAGGAAGPWVTGLLYDLTGSYNAALVVCAVMVLAASGVLWILNGRRSRTAAVGLA